MIPETKVDAVFDCNPTPLKVRKMNAIMRNTTLLAEAYQHKKELLNRIFPTATQIDTSVPVPLLDLVPVGNNIVGVGYGAKMTEEKAIDGQIAVRVYVRHKLPRDQLSANEIVPANIQGIPTDVIAVGDIMAGVSCGASVGHYQITAGTLGCLVVKNNAPNGPEYILSNNHVLANSNAAKIGDDIYQPGPGDGGTAPSIAILSDFMPIEFLPPHGTGMMNYIDAAIAEVIIAGSVTPDVSNIGCVKSLPITVKSHRQSRKYGRAKLYQSVRKYGRSTQHTVGVVVDISASIRVGFGSNIAEFDDQLALIGAGGAFSMPGDSGALIVDAVTRKPVALLFAGATTGGISTTFANPIDAVLAHFDIAIISCIAP